MRSTGALLALAGLLGLAGCRNTPAGPGDSSPFDYLHLDVFRARFVRVPGRDRYEGRTPPIGRVRSGFEVPKPAGTRRVFVVGGSVAQLYGTDERRPRLQDLLEAALPGERVEVVGSGASGYDSSRDRLVLDELLGYQPDAIVVMSGVNDPKPLAPAFLAKTCLALRGMPLLGTACRRVLSAGLPFWQPYPPQPHFEKNIRAMARAARGKGVLLVLATLPVNLRDMPPRGRLPLADEDFFSAWTAFEAGRWGEAARRWRRHLAEHPGDAMAEYYLARCCDREGDPTGAKSHYSAAWNSGPGAPMPELNGILRRIAAEEGAALADLERAFESIASRGLVGRDLMEDDVHWGRFADPMVSLVIAQAIAKEWCRGARCASLAAEERAVLRAVRRDAAGAGRGKTWLVFRVRMWEAFGGYRDSFSERVLALLEAMHAADPGLLRRMDRVESWLREKGAGNPWDGPRGLDRWWPPMLAHVGEFHRRRGDYPEAIRFFDEALRLDTGLEPARFYRAVAEAAAGRGGGDLRALAASAPQGWRKEAGNWARYFDAQRWSAGERGR